MTSRLVSIVSIHAREKLFMVKPAAPVTSRYSDLDLLPARLKVMIDQRHMGIINGRLRRIKDKPGKMYLRYTFHLENRRHRSFLQMLWEREFTDVRAIEIIASPQNISLPNPFYVAPSG